MGEDSTAYSRRELLRAAVAVGGATALSACMDIETGTPTTETEPSESASPEFPRGVTDGSTLPERQHAWSDYSDRDSHGNVLTPRHHVLVFFNYVDSGPVASTDRDTLETALQTLEQAFEWSTSGLLFTVAYSPAYFERYETSLPGSVDLPHPEALASFEDPVFDTMDGVIHLASDHASVVLQAEEALVGNTETVNGIEMRTDPTESFKRVDRRTGFIGAGLPAANDSVDGIPDGVVDEKAPLFMGFKSGFTQNQASEDAVTIADGEFAGGTTQQISLIRTHLDQWYEQDSRWQRVAKMFSPEHAEGELVTDVGENLGRSSMIEELGAAQATKTDAFEKGVVGHTQKTARARDDNGNPLLLRRDFATTDNGHTGVHFVSLQETIEDFVVTREAMNGEDVANVGGVGVKNNNGILQYLTTKRRGNFLIPPRTHRAFPTPTP